MKSIYSEWSKKTGVEWKRKTFHKNWDKNDLVNKALTVVNNCLYGICHGAITSLGYSPGIGFIHTGRQLSFVYDIADLYKPTIAIPIAFSMAKEKKDIEKRTRIEFRKYVCQTGLLKKIANDIDSLLILPERMREKEYDRDSE